MWLWLTLAWAADCNRTAATGLVKDPNGCYCVEDAQDSSGKCPGSDAATAERAAAEKAAAQKAAADRAAAEKAAAKKAAAQKAAADRAAAEKAAAEKAAAQKAAADRAAAEEAAADRATTASPPTPVAIDWVSIEGGTFEMGSRTGDSDERPVHTVTVRAFQMSRTEVTVAQWKACVDAGKCTAPATGEYCNWLVSGRDAHPVNCVSWDQAVVFARWAGGRLPTEAEWEYAARSGGKAQRWPWGTAEADCERAVIAGCGHTSTQPVCSLRAGNSAQGLCDMAGNVWEWVQDSWHAGYTGAPMDGSAWESATAYGRVIRGGSWGYEPADARAASRSWYPASVGGGNLGLRLARSE